MSQLDNNNKLGILIALLLILALPVIWLVLHDNQTTNYLDVGRPSDQDAVVQELSVEGTIVETALESLRTQDNLITDEVPVAQVDITIDYGDDTLATTQLSVMLDPDQTEDLFAVLRRGLAESDIEVTYKDFGGDMGMFIETINGVGKGSLSKWWQYWVNDQYATVGVSSYTPVAGDVIKFVYTNEKI
jgi:hypothetical protein